MFAFPLSYFFSSIGSVGFVEGDSGGGNDNVAEGEGGEVVDNSLAADATCSATCSSER